MRDTGLRLHNETRGTVVADHVFAADNYFSRLRGLIGHPPLHPGSALWITPCQQVHTHFLSGPLQIVFVDRELRVVHVIPELRPWRISPWLRKARSVLELAPRNAGGIAQGDQLRVR